MKQMPYTEFAQVREERNIRLIDVREENEYNEVHVQGAELWALSKIRAGNLPEIDDRTTALICRSGGRSAMAAQMLEAAGFGEFINISDGTLGAISHGDPGDLVYSG